MFQLKMVVVTVLSISLLFVPTSSEAGFISDVKVKKLPKIKWNKLFVAKKNVRANISGESNTALSGEITALKTDLFGKDFIYGASLQFVANAKENTVADLIPVAVLGNSIGRFQLLNDRLLFIEDGSNKSESDINKPGRLIFDFQVKGTNETSVTFLVNDASRAVKLFLGTVNNQRSSWVRSMEYVPDSQIFLVESSLEVAENSISEFMEFLIPRDQFVPKDFLAKFDDIALEKNAERFRMISTPLWMNHPDLGRINTKIAQRFSWKPGTTIDWWTTTNAPDNVLPLLQTGIEAWNRYSQKMWKSDIVKFRGRLPDNIHVGDPRYNIVVWDSTLNGDSAWESQGSDPITGMQTHSIIYLPQMWLETGKKFWEDGSYTEEKSQRNRRNIANFFKTEKFLGKDLPTHCVTSALQNVNWKSLKDPETFGKDLLKTTLFHEAGHGLGLDHNFKGSLVWDFNSPTPVFSNSIMDYNRFNEETSAAYESTESANGPILEYDRQILSFLYNQGKDISDQDPVLPSCSDPGSHIREGGIDPTCSAYDLGKNPVESVEKNIALLNEEKATYGRTKSLLLVLKAQEQTLPAADSLKSDAELHEALEKFKSKIKGITKIYSTYMLGRDLPIAMGMLRTIHPDAGIADAEEVKMRDGAMNLLTWAANLNEFPEPIHDEFKKLQEQVATLAKNVKYSKKISDGVKEGEDFSNFFLALERETIFEIKTALVGSLAYSELAPFVIVNRKVGESIDLEEGVVKTLLKMFEDFPLAQKTVPLTTLKTFHDTDVGKKYLERAKIYIQQKINSSTNATEREEYRKVLSALVGA